MTYIYIALNSLIIILSVFPYRYYFNEEVNYVPLQIFFGLLSIFLFIKFKILKEKLFYFLTLSLVLLIIFILNSNYPENFFSSVIVVYFFLGLIMNFFQKLKFNSNLLLISIDLTIILFAIFSFYYNLNFINDPFSYYAENEFAGVGGRFKGWGSGLEYCNMSTLGLIWVLKNFLSKRYNIVFASLISIPLLSTIFITQSRGPLIVLILIGLYEVLKAKEYKTKNVFYLLISLTLILFIILSNITNDYINIFERLNLSNFADIEQFTSGRSFSQLYILDAVFNSSFYQFLFGNGLNSFKEICEVIGIEYPHFDVLLIMYDGGLLVTTIYIYSFQYLLKNNDNSSYLLLFFLNGLHSNSINSPSLLILGYLMTKSFEVISKKNSQMNKKYIS